jgi:hypothetical protein
MFYQEPVVKQEKKGRQKSDHHDGIRNDIGPYLVEENKVDHAHHRQVKDYHIKDPPTVLNTGVPDDAFVAAGNDNRQITASGVEQYALLKFFEGQITQGKIEAQQEAEEARKGYERQVNKDNDPPGKYPEFANETIKF